MSSTPSSTYQHVLLEIAIDPAKLLNFSNEDGMGFFLENNGLDPVIQDYRNKLLHELRKLIRTVLTDHQRKVLEMSFQGLTQSAIGKRLGITQAAVHKAISGNIDYTKGGRKRYGGAINKLKRACSRHLPILVLLNDLENYKRAINDLHPIPLVMPVLPAYIKKKACAGCKKYKTFDKFYRDIYSEDGHRSRCKACSGRQK